VFAPDVNQQIGLHLAHVVTARTGPCRLGTGWMRLHHMLHEPTLLNKLRIAGPTCMVVFACMLLHMIEHRILACLCDTAGWADKEPLLILNVCQLLNLCHYSVLLLHTTSVPPAGHQLLRGTV